MPPPLPVPNRRMRRLVLERQAIGPARPGFDKEGLLALIEQLGYVQVDSINVVERAHHLILFSRQPRYRREWLTQLVEQDRSLFEHWTHDASLLPASLFPHWRHRFEAAESGPIRANGSGAIAAGSSRPCISGSSTRVHSGPATSRTRAA